MSNVWKHFKTITHHRHLVMQGCFRVGLIRQGLLHDLSKYAPAEFLTGVRYYQGNRSPNAAERDEIGYSTAWMHHKGRNKHHFEYWTDLDPVTHVYAPVQMPNRYLAEMMMDRIAACKTYEKENYTSASPLRYFQRAHETSLLHPETNRKLLYLLTMLRDEGEDATFAFIRSTVLKDLPFGEAAPESK